MFLLEIYLEQYHSFSFTKICYLVVTFLRYSGVTYITQHVQGK